MSPPDKKAANAAGGKTARACDSCLRKRARWYCAADDAFLCQACDSSVHSANSLARRHERVRLKTASFKPSEPNLTQNSEPAWHQGFRRKARTPRHAKPPAVAPKAEHPIPLVPEIGNDEALLHTENEEQLLYRVPIYDPFVAELCKPETPSEAAVVSTVNAVNMGIINDDIESKDVNLENLHGLLPSDMELAEFAADVESLLGRGLDEDSFGMEGLGLLEAEEGGNLYSEYNRFGGSGCGRVKIEEEEEEMMKAACTYHLDQEMEMSRETLDLNFDCDTPTTGGEEDEEKVVVGGAKMATMMVMKKSTSTSEEIMKRRISLRLDYDAVITAWASQGSPWTTGDRPEFNPNDCWIGTWGTELHQGYGGEMGYTGVHVGLMGDGGREARVSRYREKRRTRLFSKKIRYEVRKLNAEKRPRMKGRFVKRASFVGVGSGFPF